MNSALSIFIVTALILAGVFGTGFWLSRLGAPYGAILFNLHKLIGVGAGAFLGLLVSGVNKTTPLQPGQTAAVVVAAIFFVLTIVAGGLVSVLATGGLSTLSPKLQYAISIAHQMLPYPTVLSFVAVLYLLFGK